MAKQLATLGVGGQGAAGSTTELYDQFIDTNGTALTAHTMDIGPGWTSLVGTWQINASNQATQTAAGTGYKSVDSDSTKSDVTVTCDLTTAAGGTYAPGILARVQDGSNWLSGFIDSDGHLYIHELNAGTDTIRASVAFTSASGNTYTVKLVCSGTNLTFSQGATSCSYGSESFLQTATKCGLTEFTGFGYVNGNLFKNFKVTNP
jgi:hypothetical protein